MEGCRNGCPSGWLSPQRNSGHLHDYGPSLPIAQFDRAACSRDLLVPNFFHLKMMEATVLLGTFNAADNFFGSLPPDLCLDTILSRGSTDNSFNLMA